MISQTISKLENSFQYGDDVAFNCYMAQVRMEIRAYCRDKGYYNEVRGK
jgi:hypothetical protein